MFFEKFCKLLCIGGGHDLVELFIGCFVTDTVCFFSLYCGGVRRGSFGGFRCSCESSILLPEVE